MTIFITTNGDPPLKTAFEVTSLCHFLDANRIHGDLIMASQWSTYDPLRNKAVLRAY